MNIHDFISVTKALSDPHRLRAVMALQEGELCVCQLISLLELAPSTVSKHMSQLRQAGMVTSRKKGKWVYYSLPDDGKKIRAGALLQMTFEYIRNDGTINTDRLKIRKIRAAAPESLCKM